MVKPILYYALTRGAYSRNGFKVLGVTSTKGGQVYGRDEYDAVTHVAERDVIHRFPEGTTLEFAQAAQLRADAERKKHEPGIRMARDEVSRLEEVKNAAVLRAAKGEHLPPQGRAVRLDGLGCGWCRAENLCMCEAEQEVSHVTPSHCSYFRPVEVAGA